MYFNLSPFISHLRRGGLIIYPTETAYALGCDATNQKAVDLVFKIKHRPKNKPLPLIASSLAMVRRYCRLSATEERLARRYWPGPLTLVVPSLRSLPAGKAGRGLRGGLVKGVVAKNGTVAIRVSSHPIARELSRGLGRPIVSTSANISGKGESYSVEEVKGQLKNVGADNYPPILVIDGGRLPKRKTSTIMKIEKGKVKILRQGEVEIN